MDDPFQQPDAPAPRWQFTAPSFLAAVDMIGSWALAVDRDNDVHHRHVITITENPMADTASEPWTVVIVRG
jgi:hypothetical protein